MSHDFFLWFIYWMTIRISMISLPHIFKGASSSKRIGCDKKISLDLRHNPRISPSVNCTFFPGRAPRTRNKIEFRLLIGLWWGICKILW